MITHITSLVCRGNPVTLEVKCLIQIKQLVQKEPPFHLSFEQVVHCHIGSPNVNPFFKGMAAAPPPMTLAVIASSTSALN